MSSIDDKYAYVTLVMNGSKYVHGALAMAWSIKRFRTKYPIICMVTPDVNEHCTEMLNKVFNYLIVVPYISYKCIPLKTSRQRNLYNSWIESSFTKFNCLNPVFFGR